MKLEAWIGVAAICVFILVAIYNKLWDPIAAHVGSPFAVDLLVNELGRKLLLLRRIRINYLYPNLLSRERSIWVKRVHALQEEEKNIKDGLAACGRLSYFRRCSIGKNVKTEIQKAKDLIEHGIRLLENAETRATHPVDVMSQQLQVPLLVMEATYAKVIDFISHSDAEPALLGIWGMGGMGKTTLIKRVCDSRSDKYPKSFSVVLFVHAAKGFNTVADLQRAISSSLELAQIGNDIPQSENIHNYLQDKDFLLVVDDLWEYLDLEKVGIPSFQPDPVQTHRRKVVFTTRSVDVCNRMGCSSEAAIQMKCLNKEDALALFAQHLRKLIFDHPEIHELAEEIVEECNGLPIALCTIGKLMSREKDPVEWRTTRDLLKKSKLHEISDTPEDIFNHVHARVLDFIKDKVAESVLLGIWGMGGVGKTNLIERVCDSRSDQYPSNFSVVVCAHAPNGFTTVADLQNAICISMGLAQIGNEIYQSETIHNHLQDKDFLLLVDNLCEYLDLEKVGIPSLQPDPVQAHRRKVVFTTRSMDVCTRMGCGSEDTIQMKCLNKEDAGSTLAQNVGEIIVDAKGINKLAEKEKEEKKIKDKYESNIKRRYISKEVAELNTANDLIGQVDRLLAKIKARLGPIRDVPPEELSSEFPGMEGYYVKVLHLIKEKSAHPVLMAIWGMPGVGKTTLLRLVCDFYTDDTCFDCSFDHIMFVSAGTGCVLSNVQHAIAISLGLDWDKMPSDEDFRAIRISSYLQHRSFLLLLDDVREPLNLRDVGLPPMLSHRSQKIVFVTTSKDVCALMGCRASNTIEMHCLGKDDAWELFKGKVGHGIIDDDPEVELLARQMVSQCKGVPLALCSLGRAMSNKRNPREWRSTYAQLKDMSSEPSETNDKVATLQDTIRTAEQVQDKTKGNMSDSLRKRATQWPLQAARDADRYLL